MTNKMRRDYQRKFNRKIRLLNKNLEKDELWRGRFIFLQKDARWEEFYDHSGGILHLIIRAFDKKTNYYHDYIIEYAPWMTTLNWHLTMDIGNKFIVEDANVWKEKERPSLSNAVDYTNTKVNIVELMNRESNYYTPYNGLN